MTLTTSNPSVATRPTDEAPEPTWEVAHLFPAQGTWSVEEYLELKGNRLVEFSNGIVAVLAPPPMAHQLTVMSLSDALRSFVRPGGLGTVLFAPFCIRLSESHFRQPDVMLMRR